MPLDDYDVYKEAILRVLPAAPEIPLEAPPAESFDLVNVQICPACGSPDAAVQQIEDAEVAKCPQCQCEFSPHLESISRKVIRRISEHRQRRIQRFMERLPVVAEVPGIDPVDYALFRKIVNGATVETPDEATSRGLAGIREKFIRERVRGWTDARGQRHPPITQAQAEQRWLAAEPKFKQPLVNPNEQMAQRLRLGAHRPLTVSDEDLEDEGEAA